MHKRDCQLPRGTNGGMSRVSSVGVEGQGGRLQRVGARFRPCLTSLWAGFADMQGP